MQYLCNGLCFIMFIGISFGENRKLNYALVTVC